MLNKDNFGVLIWFCLQISCSVVLESPRRRSSPDDAPRGRDLPYRRKLLSPIGSPASSITVTDESLKPVFLLSETDGNALSVMTVEVLYIFFKIHIYVNLLFSIVAVKKRRIIYFANLILTFVFVLFLFMFYDKYIHVEHLCHL